MHIVREEMKMEQQMPDSIINFRGPSEYRKDKLNFCVSKIPYKTQDTEQNTSNSFIK